MTAICVMFAVAGVMGTMDILTFLRIREIVSPPLIQGSIVERKGGIAQLVLVEPMRVVTDSMRDNAFRRYALYGATMALGVSVSDQFFWLNALEVVKLGRLGTNFVFLVARSAPCCWPVVGGADRPLGPQAGADPLHHWHGRWAVGLVLHPAGQLACGHILGTLTCALGGGVWAGQGLATCAYLQFFRKPAAAAS